MTGPEPSLFDGGSADRPAPQPLKRTRTLRTPVAPDAAEQQQDKLTVGGLTRGIRALLEAKFSDVVVEGEISNFVDHRSGHRYWTLKDAEASISCVFWKTRYANFPIKDGMKVICRGRVTVYPPRGNYQLDVMQLRPVGIGDLQKAFEALYAKLELEGLFEPSRKRPIPAFPTLIGIVTSETGAALQDILTVLRRRYPIARVLLRPAAVQGVGSELDVARAIQEFNLTKGANRPDVLIVGRGGGSLEDLWAFNEEAVARAIYASRIPIISGVGHEPDFTIADFVADLRAPTPTAAAELATPDRNEILSQLRAAAYAMEQTVENRLNHLRRDLDQIGSVGSVKSRILERLSRSRLLIEHMAEQLGRSVSSRMERLTLKLERDEARLISVNPYAVLQRGYTLLQSPTGEVIGSRQRLSQESVSEGELMFADGKVRVKIEI